MKILKKLVRSLYKRMWKEEFAKNSNMSDLTQILHWKNEWIDFEKYNTVENFDKLTKNMDIKSVNETRFLIKRWENFSKLLDVDFYKDLYMKKSNIFSEQEIFEQQDCSCKMPKLKEKYKMSVNFYEPSVIYMHCGLKEVSNKVLEYIKNKDFIDGGACIGDSALILTEYNPCNIYAFEPVLKNRSDFQKTISLNADKMQNVKIIPKGLGDKIQKTNIKICEHAYGACSMEEMHMGYIPNEIFEEIEITTIDDFVSKNNLNCGLIKLDTEGMEENILNGSVETIKKYRPVLLISIYHSKKDFFKIKPQIDEIVEDTYSYKLKKCQPYNIFSEIMLIAYPKELEG